MIGRSGARGWTRRRARAPRARTGARWAALALGAVLVGCGAGADEPRVPTGPRLELALDQSLGVPDAWLVREILPLAAGGAALFLDHPGRLVRLPDTIAPIRLPNRSLVGMRERDDRRIEVVDRVFKEILRFSEDGGVERVGTLAIEAPLWDATWRGDRWWIVAGDSAGPPRLIQATHDGEIADVSPEVAPLLASQARAGTIGGRPAVSEIARPFRVLLLEDGLWRDLELAAPAVDLPAASIALDLVALNEVVLQTLVDQTSLRRVVRLLSSGSDPHVLREVELGAPVALLGTDPAGRLVGLGPAGGREVLWYSWSWRESVLSPPAR